MLFPTYTQFHSTLMLFTIFSRYFRLCVYFIIIDIIFIFFFFRFIQKFTLLLSKITEKEMILFLHITERKKKKFNAIKKIFSSFSRREKKKNKKEICLNSSCVSLIHNLKRFFLSLSFTSSIATYFTFNGNSYVPRDTVKIFRS